jgi:DNA-binding NarL/FixJ family response regulator
VLSAREQAILQLLAAGQSTDAVATRLEISPNTVRSHVRHLLGKLELTSRRDAIALMRAAVVAREHDPDSVPESYEEPSIAATSVPSVLVAGAPGMWRTTVAAAIESCATVRLVGEADDDDELPRVARDKAAQVVIVDRADTCARLRAHDSDAKTMVVTNHPSADELREAVEAGADGYVPSTVSIQALAAVVLRIAAGQAYVPSAMLKQLLRDLGDRREQEQIAIRKFAQLTKRERTTLGLLVQELDDQSIAQELFLSPHTARTHVQNLLRKLGVRSRAEAVRLANDYGLVDRYG